MHWRDENVPYKGEWPDRNPERFHEAPATYSCPAQWTDNCQINQCKCDLKLATEMTRLYLKGELPDDAFVINADGTGFDRSAECTRDQTAPSRGDGKQCCGTYPNRSSFNTERHDCCANTFLADIGECI